MGRETATRARRRMGGLDFGPCAPTSSAWWDAAHGRLMRLLDRLVLGTFLRLFVISLLATPPLFVLGDVTENLDRYLDRGTH